MTNLIFPSHRKIADEELLLFYRKGDQGSLEVLTRRFYGMRFYCANALIPNICQQLGESAIVDVFYRAFTSAVDAYEFQRTKFATFFMSVLNHELIREIKSQKKEMSCPLESLDAEKEHPSEDAYLLRDSTPSGSEMDDPRAYFNYNEALQKILCLPKKIKPAAVEMTFMTAEGTSFDEVAESFQVARSAARYNVSKYRKWAIEVLGTVYGVVYKKPSKRKKKIPILIEDDKDEDSED